ncbi:MAG: hypothetical protein MJZ33_01420 [Paludibacteraceae bacterium]|nr:hypothetical protein [Paludibacteraceae bacterium]
MLKELFESCFYVTFPAKAGCVVNLTEVLYRGDFALVDSEACRDCRYMCSRVDSEREQLLIRSADGIINAIKVDDLFAPIGENLGRMCDFILDDGHKMALIEMTCATKEHVGSKRVTCIGQLYNTLTNLRTCGPVKEHIEKETECEAVFSWKETNAPSDLTDPIEASMTAMTDLADEVYSADNVSRFDDGFIYREIRYPIPLRW